MMRVKLVALAVSTVISGFAVEASAHIRLMSPVPRDNGDSHKDNLSRDPTFTQPCGIARTTQQTVTPLTAGQPVTVTWTETVDHSGCFYIDVAATDAGPFQILAMVEDGANTAPKLWSQSVTIPAGLAGDKAVLRVRQDMSGTKGCPVNPTPGNMYYSCGNVKITGGASGADAGATGGAGGARDGGATPDAASGTGGAASATGGRGTGGDASGTGGASTGGAATGGSGPGTGGAVATGGSATGGSTATGGRSGSETGGRISEATGGSASPSGDKGESGGCQMAPAATPGALGFAVAGALMALRRRRRTSR